ncbi:heat shock hsp20, putative [Babesia ovata]|uniref:Heat shock hsp20, putative n=1 Tax=Babesia ovata TaxID=189622 RepID=A0A2H6KHI9_9APIC|nr:heat shock hsp20, putative [Babesia ovata]GBE62441.1 heat shock hsp20, putative [Babesia ovata]
MSDWVVTEEKNVPIDHISRRRSFPVRPPPLRIYNPIKVIGFDGNIHVPKYRFWNPFMPENVLRAAYVPVVAHPFGDRTKTHQCRSDNVMSSIHNLHSVFDAVERQMDAWSRWILGDPVHASTTAGALRDAHSLTDFMNVGRRLFNTWDNHLEPVNDAHQHARDHSSRYYDNASAASEDLRNYRIATDRANQAIEDIHSRLESNDDRDYNDSRGELLPVRHSGSGSGQSDDMKYYKMTFHLPVLNEEDVKVSIREGVLTVRADADEVASDDNHSVARRSQRFHHTVRLPANAEVRLATAKFANGTLTVKIPLMC